MAIILLFAFLLLSGCKSDKREVNDNDSFIISGITVDLKGTNIITNVEAIVINSFAAEGGIKAEIFKGTGKTFLASFDEIRQRAVKNLDLTHTAVVVLSDNINSDTLEEIVHFLEEKRAPYSLCFFEAKNPEKLLYCKKQSSLSISYDLIESFKNKENNFKNRLYEFIGAQNEKLPIIEINDDEFYLKGEKT